MSYFYDYQILRQAAKALERAAEAALSSRVSGWRTCPAQTQAADAEIRCALALTEKAKIND